MKKSNSLFIVPLLSLLLFSCDKKSTTTNPNSNNNPNNNPNNTPASPYYFKFTLDGKSYDLTADIPQYMPVFDDNVGGYQVADASLKPSIGLSFQWKNIDTVKESQLMALVGKTIYFNDTLVDVDIEADETLTGATWFAEDTADANYNIKIANISFLKNDTSIGKPLKIYVISGTCSAVMSNGTKTSILSNGDFKFRISRHDF